MAFDTKPVNKVSDAKWFLKEAAEKLNWEDLSDDTVVDIGCGTGTSSVTFLELFPNVKKMIAIDLYKSNIDAARAENPHTKLKYVVADIQDRLTIKQWKGKMSKAISTYCFNTLRDVGEGFENLCTLLQPEGEAALLIKLVGPFDELLRGLYYNKEWNPYLAPISEVFPPGIEMTDKSYRYYAENTGLEVIECEKSERLYDYDSEEECGKFLFDAIPLVRKMNRSTEVEFKEYLVESLVLLSPKTEDGKVCLRNNVVSLLLRRPY